MKILIYIYIHLLVPETTSMTIVLYVNAKTAKNIELRIKATIVVKQNLEY